MKKAQINIFTTDLVWMGMVEEVRSLVLRSSWNEMPNSELTVSRSAQGIEELQIGRVLVINNDRTKPVIIEEITASLDDEYWNFTLIPLKALMNYRIAHPSDSATFIAKKQSNIMMNLVKNNCQENIRDANRTFLKSDGITNMFAVASIKEYGDTIDYVVNWETGLLGDALTTLAKMNGTTDYPLGWNLYIHSSWVLFYMDTYQSTIKTINQSTNPPVVFSEEFGNLKNASYTKSITDWRNWGYVAWNDGTTDQVTSVANSKYGTAKWFNRKEILLDSSKKTSTQAANQGKAELTKSPRVESFTAEIIDNPNTMTTYGLDWVLGDVVTVQSADLKKNTLLSIDTQITEIEEIYDNGEYSINATFGDAKLNLIQKIKNTIRHE